MSLFPYTHVCKEGLINENRNVTESKSKPYLSVETGAPNNIRTHIISSTDSDSMCVSRPRHARREIDTPCLWMGGVRIFLQTAEFEVTVVDTREDGLVYCDAQIEQNTCSYRV